MTKYIKSYSNYVIQKKHQEVNDGKIYERDATTIGGLNQFAPGQTPIYSTGNFIITINSDDNSSRNILPKNWLENGEGNSVWDSSVLSAYTSDIEGSLDYNIVLKKDNYDLRDFAYYGSCVDLIKNSINDILSKFPGELYANHVSDATIPCILDVSSSMTELNAAATTTPVGQKTYYEERKSTDSDYISVEMGWKIPVDANCHTLWNDDGTPFSAKKAVDFNGDSIYVLENPFNIDIFTQYIADSEITDKLKYFANDGYLNYEIIDKDGNIYPITEWNIVYSPKLEYQLGLSTGTSKCNSGRTCPGDYMGIIYLKSNDAVKMKIYVFMSKNYKPIYLVEYQYLEYHIRPLYTFYDEFMEKLSLFEKVLLNTESDEKYKATFEIVSEDDYGYNSTVQSFVFPVGNGGYNLGTNDSNFLSYVQELSRIAEFYDDRFCDNLYRSMTHEAIKNFDWTASVLDENEAENIVESADKIKNFVRLTGFEFDEVKAYIDNIGNMNTITYDDKKNLPDYFLTDALDLDGWDVKLIYPLMLTEYYDSGTTKVYIGDEDRVNVDESANTYTESTGSSTGSEVYHVTRVFGEDTTDILTPWSKKYYVYPDGYFIECSDSSCVLSVKDENSQVLSSITCENIGGMAIIPATESDGEYKYNSALDRLLPKISQYYSEAEYTIPQVNNEFMKRLKINSKYILRKKGTYEGIESLLSLFGMRSKRWYNSLPDYEKKTIDKFHLPYDYDMEEFTSFTPRIEERIWYEGKGMYKYDWYNSCKTVAYNTDSYLNGDYIAYQGLPLTYRDSTNMYIKAGQTIGDVTTIVSDAFIDGNGNKVKVRYLYPNFESDGIYDGNPYYQMNGGWENTYPYKYDRDNNILTQEYSKGKKAYLYNDTLRTVQSVSTIKDLLNFPTTAVKQNDIYYVNNLSTDFAIIGGTAYELFKESDDSGKTIGHYFEITAYNNSIVVGDQYFYGNVLISDIDGNVYAYNLDTISDDSVLKIYCQYNSATTEYGIVVKTINSGTDYYNGSEYGYSATTNNISNDFSLFMDGKYYGLNGEATHYFRLNFIDGINKIGIDGWEQLNTLDKDYYRLNAIVDVLKGNNPHSGNFTYDNGYEYFKYFRHLFKYAYDDNYENPLFNELCFTDVEATYKDIGEFGFSGLIPTEDAETCENDYMDYLKRDTKVHYFGNKYINNYNGTTSFLLYNKVVLDGIKAATEVLVPDKSSMAYRDTMRYLYHEYRKTADTPKIKELKYTLDKAGRTNTYNLSSIRMDDDDISGITYGKMTTSNAIDGVTNQIVNNKVFKITFYMKKGTLYSVDNLEETKYLQSVIVPYLEQMMPSGVITMFDYKSAS
jgi:hypothetical protein